MENIVSVMINDKATDFPVGQTVEIEGVICVVKEDDSSLLGCISSCIFGQTDGCSRVACTAAERKDERSVYFEPIKK